MNVFAAYGTSRFVNYSFDSEILQITKHLNNQQRIYTHLLRLLQTLS